ncbi:MAG: secondary thiamine-phosphate synthase enzyme YjbQ [Myxococcota bacterium]|nr:secondary thiamine-phosphate synthase enzyme YjbQ [Myxococcota bacterium]
MLEIETTAARQALDVTAPVEEALRRAGVRQGLCHVMVLGATAAVVVNENDDPAIGDDLLDALARAAPEGAGWRHDRIDGNAHAHIQSALLGPSETVAVEDGRLVLGRWQGLMLVELDGPRRVRRLAVTVLASAS